MVKFGLLRILVDDVEKGCKEESFGLTSRRAYVI